MIGAGHVGDEEIHQAVAVEIAEIRAHGEPGRMADGVDGGIGEGAVAVVDVNPVGVVEIIADPEIGLAVAVEIEPGRRKTMAAVIDARGPGDIGESAIAVVVAEDVGAADDLRLIRHRADSHRVVELFILGEHPRAFARFDEDRLFFGKALGAIPSVGEDVEVQLAVAVVIAKSRSMAGVHEVEAKGLGLFGKRAIAVVDEKLIGGEVIADVNIELAVAIDIGEGAAYAPCVAAVHAGPGGDIFELHGGDLAKELVFSWTAGEVDVGPAIAVKIPDRHAARGHGRGIKEAQGMGFINGVDKIHAGFGLAQFLKHRRGCG